MYRINILSDTKILNNSTEFCLIPKKYIKFISSELEFDGNIKINTDNSVVNGLDFLRIFHQLVFLKVVRMLLSMV